jgi:hypothetical protein
MSPDPLAPFDRRRFLQGGAIAAGALSLPVPANLGAILPANARKTERVVLIAFAGGVRSKEVLDTPENAPNLMAIASAGVTYTNVGTANLGHYGAALSIFTGNAEAMSIRDSERGISPTIFEYLRKECGFTNSDIWLSTTNGAQGRLFAHSRHPDFGADYAANVLDSDGIFNKEFKDVLESFGRPKEDTASDRKVIDQLAGAIDPAALGDVEGVAPDAAQTRRVERFILDELRGKNSRLTVPGAGDAKAIRVGHSILNVFKPKFLGITLNNHDIAHGSYNGYVEVIRRNDAEIGRLWDAIQADEELRATTTIMICPEFGRDQNLNERNGLDHGDRTDSMRRVFMIGAGPDFKTNKVIHKEIQTLDLCPTALALFSRHKAKYAAASVIKEAFA